MPGWVTGAARAGYRRAPGWVRRPIAQWRRGRARRPKADRRPALSVVMPVYNVERYLRRAVDSVLSQSFGDLELILVNDGSTDACGQLCDSLAERDSRIRVIHKTNEGLGAARNTGIEPPWV
jgi:cellulose synthase/poly-beta-1,6-N-acetylglucosamine synthase-like glycosyltransferase